MIGRSGIRSFMLGAVALPAMMGALLASPSRNGMGQDRKAHRRATAKDAHMSQARAARLRKADKRAEYYRHEERRKKPGRAPPHGAYAKRQRPRVGGAVEVDARNSEFTLKVTNKH